jgi:hypothetical protein
MQAACIDAYPDPTFYMQIHILCIVPHSNRVFTATCLKMAGLDDDAIAFRLCWARASVPTYLRECASQHIPVIIAQAMTGAILSSS